MADEPRKPSPIEQLILDVEAELAKHRSGPQAVRLGRIHRSLKSGKVKPPEGTRLELHGGTDADLVAPEPEDKGA